MSKDRKWLSADMCRAESAFCGAAIAFRDGGCMYEELLHKAEGMIEVAVAEALREEAELYHSTEATATGPERDLAEQALEKLEWLAREGGEFPSIDRPLLWVSATATGFKYIGPGLPNRGAGTRADALALLKGAK